MNGESVKSKTFSCIYLKLRLSEHEGSYGKYFNFPK